MKPQAVAIDLGATSIRYAHGELDGERLTYRIVDQQPNTPVDHEGKPCWDFKAILGFCESACDYAKEHGASVGIDSWGVDHGFFIPGQKELIHPPVCYRDPKHHEVFESLAAHRSKLFRLTGIAHQPFNTIYQLHARKLEHPDWPDRGVRWLILPDLLNCTLCGGRNYELTQASTTQLMGTDGNWCAEAFEIAGWPVPEVQPSSPGRFVGATSDGVRMVSVGSHDTASAVAGLGVLEEGEAFLNVGTWSLLGCVLEGPLVSQEAEDANFSNEWTVDGRVRFLKNIPGFYVINRLHEELGIRVSVPEWIDQADRSFPDRIDLFRPEFFNPPAMVEAVRAGLSQEPKTPEAWAGAALMSLVQGTADQLANLECITGRTFHRIRLAGGGSKSETFCEALAEVSGQEVLAGPAEATVLGNLAAQFLAQGHFASWNELGQSLRRNLPLTAYRKGS